MQGASTCTHLLAQRQAYIAVPRRRNLALSTGQRTLGSLAGLGLGGWKPRGRSGASAAGVRGRGTSVAIKNVASAVAGMAWQRALTRQHAVTFWNLGLAQGSLLSRHVL